MLRFDSAPEVTRRTSARPLAGVIVHRSRLAEDEVEYVERIPVTSVARTLLDLAAVLSKRQLERAMHEAEVRRLTDPVGLPDLLRRHPRRGGIRKLRELLTDTAVGPGVARSKLEQRFAELIEREGMPRPELNAPIAVTGSFLTVDCLWRGARLAVELDGRAFHDARLSFEEDRRRDRLLQAAGWRVVRITWAQLRDEPDSVLADLRATLAGTGPRP
jgi:hypothetical protein